MSLRAFSLGIVASFGIGWLLVVVMPFLAMRAVEPPAFDPEADGTEGFFNPKRAGRTLDGAMVYAANGCNQCHSQLVRPTYAGADMLREDWGGLAGDPDRGDTRRETSPDDFTGERVAQIGVARIGPDLSNLGRRLDARLGEGDPSPEEWLLRHLYDPRLEAVRARSVCPPHRFLFVTTEVRGERSNEALDVPTPAGRQVLPTPEARALVSYLLNLRKDHPLPARLIPPSESDFAPED